MFDNTDPAVFEHRKKSLRIPDACKRVDTLPIEVVDPADLFIIETAHRGRDEPEIRRRAIAGPAECSAVVLERISLCEHLVNLVEARYRLAHRTGRQQSTVAEPAHPIHHRNLVIASLQTQQDLTLFRRADLDGLDTTENLNFFGIRNVKIQVNDTVFL